MRLLPSSLLAGAIFTFALLLSPSVARSQENETSETAGEGDAYVAMTTTDPWIAVDKLQILVRPLTKGELQVEADAWFKLLRAKAAQVSAARLGAKKVTEALGTNDQSVAEEQVRQAESIVDLASKKVEQAQKEVSVDTTLKTDEVVSAEDGNTENASTDDAATENPSPESVPIEDSDEAASTDSETAVPSTNVKTVRDQLLKSVTTLQSERTALADRLTVVLASLELKGGEVKEYRDYIYAISGIELDTTDVTSAWSGVVGWLRSKEGGQRWAWNMVRFFTILLITWIVAKIVARIVNWLLDRKIRLSQLAERLISQTIKNVVFAIGFAVALTALEIDITPIVAAIGATGLVIGLALQGTLSNFASGLMILINRPFDVGHVVSAGGITGTIDQMNLVSTRFRTFDNQTIYVPNNEIWNNVITNITANENRRVDLEFGIGYDDDFEEAEAIIKDIVVNHELVLSDPEPVVVTHALADSSVNIVCRPWAKTSDWWKVKTDVTRAVKKRFDEAGISIPYPQQDVHIHQVSPAK
ncbi:mechanosensitive ion channel family protein [Roseiconus lacunae]|uniref:mechanosensitive ion channel family protein n=1 Tax=Roseiconus lacunae TaxID=2605694 RepID=UPI0030900BB2|nr:mechanosensitive ion channel family protein [Stieleria sp. HD01]